MYSAVLSVQEQMRTECDHHIIVSVISEEEGEGMESEYPYSGYCGYVQRGRECPVVNGATLTTVHPCPRPCVAS